MIVELIFIYVVLTVGLYFGGSHLMFPAPEPSYELDEPFFKISADQGEEDHIAAIYLENPQAEYTILYSHGNAEDLGHLHPLLEQYRNHGFSVFAYDYRGYGHSSGRTSEQNTYADIKSAYEYLNQEIGVPSDQIIALGRSVGGGPVLHLAQKTSLAGIILESSFVSAARVLTRIPIFPLDRFRNLARVREIDTPMLLVHGTADAIVPIWHSKKLYKAANSSHMAKFWVEKAGHNDLIQTAGRDYWDTLTAFAAELPPPQKAE